ncbi:integrin alpha-D-like [Cololabis saira]|uniref:integrin alpha-D-like n=1 Tax=Cololabis saira TaxID=129043 RepID=UPI002AD2AD36|nr:integrin alpha-D-like [Cololabis saira]
MDWIITATLFWSVLQASLCFNIDPVAWRSLSHKAAGFGYKVVQRRSDLLVSAPLEQYSGNKRGQIFKCSTTSSQCQPLNVKVPPFAVNMSLGLSMANDPNSQMTMACGPTIPKDCRSITLYNGVCFEIAETDRVEPPVPASIEECSTQADIAFLLDGSGSVDDPDFTRMKTFVKNMIGSFQGKDTQFAIVQFSWSSQVHYYFNNFPTSNWQRGIDNIEQKKGGTHTAAAIRTVVNDVFSGYRGSRPNVKKILLVITDGESQDRNILQGVITLAEAKSIVRFAVGVGDAFRKPQAKRELDIIASVPSDDHVFQVENFAALDKIQKTLQNKIFSIEGSQSSGATLNMELSQQGFTAAYIPGGFQMAVVGANQWRGGYKRYARQTLSSEYEPESLETDSYLGYSMEIAKTPYGMLTVVGAPRYQHKGAVEIVFWEKLRQRIEPHTSQTGEYFGAEVSVMDVDLDSFTDLILISAPMHKEPDREGRVYVCALSRLNVNCDFDSESALRGGAFETGRFGSSLAVLPDLNTDKLSDLAIGAPLENDGQGSIYIFLGKGGRRISITYSQRIAASQVQSGLKFFGWSISQKSFDQSNDNLPDLAVGSKGTVVLLRSKPIVMVDGAVSFSPNEIPTQNEDCTKPLETTAQICFTMTRRSGVNTAQARINYTLTLDATRKPPKNRAYISEKQQEQTGSLTVDLSGQRCNKVKFLVESCPEDALNPLENELSFIFEGLPSNTNLKPSLREEAQTRTFYSLGFEINCGADEKCVDNLKVDLNFRSSVVKVGIDEFLEVIVTVENREENSYNSRVSLTYPVGFSYTTFTVQQGRTDCSSLDSENGITLGKTDCTVDKPIFKSKSKVVFTVSYRIAPNSQLDRRIFLSANATSGNQQHSPLSELYKKKEIDVKYSIFITIASSLSYINFTYGNNNLQKPLEQQIKVTNHIRELNFTVVIKVPVKLGDEDIWADLNSLQIPHCKSGEEEKPNIENFVTKLKDKKVVDCSVASCRVFRCSGFMGKLDSMTYMITANISSGWLEQIGLKSAKFLLTSTASLEYDTNQYIFFSTASNNTSPVHKIEAEVEVYAEPDLTKAIVGGTLGGLAFLALLTAGLYKAGFFKSKYSNMVNETGEGAADPGTEGDAPLQE